MTCGRPLSEHGVTKDSPYGTDTSTNFSQMPDSPRVPTEKEEVEKKNKKTIQQVESQLIIDGKHKPQNIHHGQKKETRMSDLYESEANAIKSSDKLKSQFIADEIKTMLSKKKDRPETPSKENKYQTHINKPIHFKALKEIIEDKKRKEKESIKGRYGGEFYLPKRGHKVEEPEEEPKKKENKKKEDGAVTSNDSGYVNTLNATGKLLSQMGKRKRGKRDVLYNEEKKSIIDNALKFVRKPSPHSPVGAEERAKKRKKNPRSYQAEKRKLPSESALDKLIAQIDAKNKKPAPKFDALELSSVLSGKKGKKKKKSLDDIIKRKRSSKPKPKWEGYADNSAITAESKLPEGMTLAEFQEQRSNRRQKTPWARRQATISRRGATELPDEDKLDQILAQNEKKPLSPKNTSDMLGDIKDKLSKIKRKIEDNYEKDHPYTDKAKPQNTGDKIIDEMPKTLERLLLTPLGIKEETTSKSTDHSNSQGDAHRMYTQEASQDTWIGSGLPQPKKTESDDEDDEEFGTPIEQGLPHNGDARQKGEEGTGSFGGLIRHNVGDGSTFAQGSGESAQITNNKLNNQMRGNKYMPRSVKRKPKSD